MIKNLPNVRFKLLCYALLSISFLIYDGSTCYAKSSNQASMMQVNVKKNITLNIKNKPVRTILVAIQKQSGYGMSFRDNGMIDKLAPRSINVVNRPIELVLRDLLANTGLDFSINQNVISIIKKSTATNSVRRVTISGKVVDKTGKKPIFGAAVVAEGSRGGVVTDDKGEFVLTVNNNQKIIVTYVGLKTYVHSKPLTEEPIVIRMEEDVTVVDEVVITGMFNKPKESYTGAVTFISKAELTDFKSKNILRTIANIDPSFNIVENNRQGSNPNALPEINIRGMTNLPAITDVANTGYDNINDFQAEQRANLNTPLFILDGFEISLQRMMDLDEEDIENVTILKDASSTAIYGSRGSNGVVVITSVKPQAGKLRVSVRTSMNLEVPDLTSYNLLNAAEKLELEVIAGAYIADKNSQSYLANQDQLNREYLLKKKNVIEGIDTYWLSKPLRTGISGNYGLNLGGGDKSFRYSLSASYNTNKGVMKGSDRNNFNGSLSISYLYKTLQFTNNISIGINNANETMYGSFSTYAELNPYYPTHDENGELIKSFPVSFGKRGGVNPLYNPTTASFGKSNYLDVRNTTSIQWDILKTLKLSANLGYSLNNKETHNYLSSLHSQFAYVTDPTEKGSYTLGTGKSKNLSLALNLSYAKVFGDHSIFVGFNTTIMENTTETYQFSTVGFTHDKFNYLSMASSYADDTPGGAEATMRNVGFTGNINYNWNRSLFLDASYRLDGTSSFGPYSRFKPFYTVGGGWTASNLNVIQEKAKWVDLIRLKYNYGVTGSLPFMVYDAITTFRYSNERYQGKLGASIAGIGNPNLTWQYTYSHNLGLDITLFNNILSLNGNIFTRLTKGSIANSNLPLSHGYTSYKQNQGNIKNSGYDIRASVRIINDQKRQITWSVSASFQRVNNILVSLSPAMLAYSDKLQARDINNNTPALLYREGESMDALYVVQSLGIDPATGKELFRKRNGTVSYTYDNNDKVAIGLNQPKVTGSINTSLRYKKLNVSMSFSVRLGGQFYNSTLMSKVENANITKNVDRRVFEDRWRTPDQFAKYKGLSDKKTSGHSSRFMQDESTLKCGSINISYVLSSKWLKRTLNVQAINLGVNSSDLFQISTIKTERGTSYPFSRRISIQASLNF